MLRPFRATKRIYFRAIVAGLALLSSGLALYGGAGEEITRAAILAASPEWQENYDHYEPPADMVESLKKQRAADLKIVVYLGLWCPDSGNNVPKFIKILDLVAAPWPVRYFSVGRKASGDVQYFVEDLKVERVPTFIVYKGGREIGRIVENPRVGMIEDLQEIVLR
jgi:hypothetical protein